MFSVVKTRKGKKGRQTLSVVPSNWVGNNCVFWPPNELISLSHDGSTKPELKWKATEGKVLAKAETFELAEARLSELLIQSDSEDAGMSTRGKPAAKKQKFVSSSYELVETLDQTPEDAPNSQPTQIMLHQVAIPSTTAGGSTTAVSLPRTTPNSGAVRKIMQALPASGSVVHEPPTSNFVNDSTSQTAVSGGNSLSAVSSNELITVDTSQQEFPEYVEQIVLPEEEMVMEITEDQHEFFPEMISPEEGISMEPIEIAGREVHVRTQNGIHTFIQLEDGSFLPISDVSQINAKLEANSIILLKVFDFMANMDRYLRKSNPGEILLDSLEAAETKDCEKFIKIISAEDLNILEAKLQDTAFAARMLKHCKSVYTLTGKREGVPFFRTFLRQILNPHTLENYSWQGVSRDGENGSFKEKFPRFIEFVFHVVRAADFQFSKEANEKSFQLFLRQKNVEMKRYDEEGKQRRVAFSRKRKLDDLKATHNPNQQNDTTSTWLEDTYKNSSEEENTEKDGSDGEQ